MRKGLYYIFGLLFIGLVLVWINEKTQSPYLTALVILGFIFYAYFRIREAVNDVKKRPSLKRSQGLLLIIAGLVLIGVGILGGYHVIPADLWPWIMISIAVGFLAVFIILGLKPDESGIDLNGLGPDAEGGHMDVNESPDALKKENPSDRLFIGFCGGIAVSLVVFGIFLATGVVGIKSARQQTLPPNPTPTPAEPAQLIPVANGPWTIRLIYYRNDDEGQSLVQNRLRFLNAKGISGVFTRNETINGLSCAVIYKGRYASKEEAKKDLTQIKKMHYAFKNACEVQIK